MALGGLTLRAWADQADRARNSHRRRTTSGIRSHRDWLLVPSAARGATTEPIMTNNAPLHPWQWPEATWREIVSHVRAGRSLAPQSWKGGARCAVALSFDADHETVELRNGGESFGRLSQGQYGGRRGSPRILRLLERHDVRATFFMPAVAAL